MLLKILLFLIFTYLALNLAISLFIFWRYKRRYRQQQKDIIIGPKQENINAIDVEFEELN